MRAIEIKLGRFFLYRNRTFMRMAPAKTLFHSTTVHEIVNRGDVFAVNTVTGVFTVIPGKAEVGKITVKKPLQGELNV